MKWAVHHPVLERTRCMARPLWFSLLRSKGSSYNTHAETPSAVQTITATSSFTFSDIISAVLNCPDSQADILRPLLAKTFVEGLDRVAKILHSGDTTCDICAPSEESSISWQIGNRVFLDVPGYSWHEDRVKIGRAQLLMALLTHGIKEMPGSKNDLVNTLMANRKVVNASRCIIRKLGDNLWRELGQHDATEVLVAVSGSARPFYPCAAADEHDDVVADTVESASLSFLGSPFAQGCAVRTPVSESRSGDGMGRNGRTLDELSGTLRRSVGGLGADDPTQTLLGILPKLLVSRRSSQTPIMEPSAARHEVLLRVLLPLLTIATI